MFVRAAAVTPASNQWARTCQFSRPSGRPDTCPGNPSSPPAGGLDAEEPAGVHGAVLAPDDQGVAVLHYLVLHYLVLGDLQVGEGLAEAGRQVGQRDDQAGRSSGQPEAVSIQDRGRRRTRVIRAGLRERVQIRAPLITCLPGARTVTIPERPRIKLSPVAVRRLWGRSHDSQDQ